MEIDFLFTIIVLMMSVIVHELSHGYVAYMFGDPTAKFAGRLTLNPLKHLDPIGSFLVPMLAYWSAGFIFGWAKPVPYNPYNLKNAKIGEPAVAAAGPLSNLLIAFFFGIVIRLSPLLGVNSEVFIQAAGTIVFVNIILAIFNLVPIPPLDGSKILFAVFPQSMIRYRQILETYSIFFILIFVFFLWQFLFPIVSFLFWLMTGMSF